MKTLVARPITQEAFTPYGDVISAGLKAGAAANQGTAVRFDWSAQLENRRPHAKANLAVFRSVPLTLPFQARLLERHPGSTQMFLPMIVSRYLVCVAPSKPDGEPDFDRLEAFLFGPGQGVNYRPGLWHHPMVALDQPAEFAMLAWEDGTPGDCEERPLPFPFLITEL